MPSILRGLFLGLSIVWQPPSLASLPSSRRRDLNPHQKRTRPMRQFPSFSQLSYDASSVAGGWIFAQCVISKGILNVLS